MPSATYLAMRAYQQARLVRARLRLRTPAWSGVRILGYHRIVDARDTLAVAPEQFRMQLDAVLETGAQPLRLSEALDLLREPVTGRFFCITFDDGYLDNLENAEPLLRQYGVPATIFVPSTVIDGDATFFWYRDPPPALTWAQIEEFVAGGLVDVQSHTKTHSWLPQLDDAQAWDEIAASKAAIEAHVPYEVTSLAYPGGHYTERDARFLLLAGYLAGLTTDPGVNVGETSLATLRRTLVFREDTPTSFTAKFAGLLDRPPLLRRHAYRRLAQSRLGP